jgi:hypothetical protein
VDAGDHLDNFGSLEREGLVTVEGGSEGQEVGSPRCFGSMWVTEVFLGFASADT